jgi:hypothetical protein
MGSVYLGSDEMKNGGVIYEAVCVYRDHCHAMSERFVLEAWIEWNTVIEHFQLAMG